jgi:hypothetical protein
VRFYRDSCCNARGTLLVKKKWNGLLDCVGKLGTISIINSKILIMTIPATTTCNSNILDVLNSKMNGNKQQLNMYSQNMMNRGTAVDHTYRSFADVVVAVTLLITTLE